MFIAANIFQPLIDVFETVLKFFHDSVGVPWGWSIILLTIAVRACLIPLTVKQIGSMTRMQQLSPEIKRLQRQYKEDKQRQQQEMMKLYKEHDVHPLGGCLPLAAQLPVFISLYYMLRQSLRADICPTPQPHLANGAVNLAHTHACGAGHGASFLFVGDLTDKATGATLIVLIVLYVGTQLASSLMMSSQTMEPTQRRLMLVMPLFFVVFVIRFPAGVMVYWITTNLWTMGQQYIIRRRIGPLKAATAVAAVDGAAAGGPGPSSPPPSSRGGGGGGSPKPGPNGSGGGGGLSGLIRRAKPEEEKQPVAAGPRGAPPKSPRKKKKRSGRRR